MTTDIDIFPVNRSPIEQIRDSQSQSLLTTWHQSLLTLPADGTHFGFVSSGETDLKFRALSYRLQAGMYFSAPGRVELSGNGSGFIATHAGWQGFFQIGGPAEREGRLRYIDGCSDSLLIAPVMAGDPCLNLLHLPEGTTQTEHTHPSCRLGMVISGHGICKTPGADFALRPGMAFRIAAEALHSFHTQEEAMRVIAWHPDSDFGPTDHNHPMINRTMIQGVSAGRRELP